MGLKEAISGFQKQIGAFDKEVWEEDVDQKEKQGINSQSNAPLKIGRVKTELIDVDLVRGSTFTKAKPENGWLETTRKGLYRVLLFPLFYKWWYSRLSSWLVHTLMLLYFLQVCSLFAFFKYSDKANNEGIFLIEVLTPVILMLILGTTYIQVVSTKAKLKSMKWYSRRDLRVKYRRKRLSRRKSSSEENEQIKVTANPPSHPPKRQPSFPAGLSTTSKDAEHIIPNSSNVLNHKKLSSYGNEDNTSIEKGKCNISPDSSKLLNHSLVNTALCGPRYIPYDSGVDNISGCLDEDFTLLNTPMEELETAGSIFTFNGESENVVHPIMDRVDSDRNLVEDNKENEEIIKAFEGCKPAEESEGYVTPIKLGEPGSRKIRRVSLLDRARKFSPVEEEHSSDCSSPSDSDSPHILESPIQSSVPTRVDGLDHLEERFQSSSYVDGGTVLLNRKMSLNKRQSPSPKTESDLEDPSWEEAGVDVTSSSTSSDTSEDDTSEEEDEAGDAHHGPSLSQLEDPLKIVHATTSSANVHSSGKVRVRLFVGNECKKTDLSVLEISSCINSKVHSQEGSTDYVIIGLLLSVFLASIPICYRFYFVKSQANVSLFSYYWVVGAARAFMGQPFHVQFVLLVVTVQRFVLSCLIFFLLAVAERTYKERCLFAKYFAHLTSARRSRKSSLPHFRLDKVSNIKAWLSLRSFLKKRGPQRSVNMIVSSAFLLTLMLISILCMEMLRTTDNFLTSLHNWEVVAWTFCLSPFLLQFIILGSEINKKFRNTSVLLTEQINLYLHMERKPHKKEDLMLVNNVLKLASKLLKELETPFKISGLVMNPIMYNITRVVVLSAFSGVLTELLGFKLKLWKIKT